MKRISIILLAFVLVLGAFAGCAKDSGTADESKTDLSAQTTGASSDTEADTKKEYTPADMRVFALKGPTGMSMAKLIDDSAENKTKNNYSFTLASAADEITAEIIKGEFEAAAVPTNLTAVLYQKTKGEIYIGAVNTLGVLYIVEKGDTVKSINDLEGKKMAVTGKGQVPEYVLSYILDKAGVKCDLEFFTDGAEVAQRMTSGEFTVAMLPIPYATKVTMGDSGIRTALSVTDEFKKASGLESDSLCQACVIIRRDFAENNPEAVRVFLEECMESVSYVKANVSDSAALMEKHGIIPAKALAEKAIPFANLTFLQGDAMKTALDSFYGVLFGANPASVGGALPDSKIYG